MIDEFLPHFDCRAAYGIRIDAPVSVVYHSLLVSDFNRAWLVRVLMTLRSGKRTSRNRVASDLHQRLQRSGFVLLAEVPNEEIVIGVIGKFWRLDGGRRLDLTPDGFAPFSSTGYAKAAWNFRLQADSPASTLLSTETRIQCLGRAARWKFRLYWGLIGPFSGLIRKAILKQVKMESLIV